MRRRIIRIVMRRIIRRRIARMVTTRAGAAPRPAERWARCGACAGGRRGGGVEQSRGPRGG
eukprot:6510064-Pyramimonas_sp.AAC.1